LKAVVEPPNARSYQAAFGLPGDARFHSRRGGLHGLDAWADHGENNRRSVEAKAAWYHR
jgi:hypothetical protein